MNYKFSELRFKDSFKVKEKEEKSLDSLRLSHYPDNAFKLFPYKASGKSQAPIVYDMEEIISGFFRKALDLETEDIDEESLCQRLISNIDIDAEDLEYFQDLISNLFFRGGDFIAENIGLYPYQTNVQNKSADRVAFFMSCVMGVGDADRKIIKEAIYKYPYNVLEKMVIDSIESKQLERGKEKPYYPIITNVQEKFKKDFYFMLDTGMTSLEDLSNLLALYYFYYVSQTCITLDQFGMGKREDPIPLYFALDWERVNKNRLCCVEGWENLQAKINHMFSHAITLEIINQHDDINLMCDYIDLQNYVKANESRDEFVASEIKSAEHAYTSCVGDYKKFNEIPYAEGGSKTDKALRHLFKCVEEQFLNTDRKRANQFYNEKFSDFCKERWVKNRKKSGLVLNLTERDIIFLTKISLRDKDRIRLIDLYKEYEYRGIYLDNTSKELLQEFFTKLNLIDKKSDSGDAQYVKRIL
ncbi:DNA phosphorothioation-dependent restriction protein DptG [Clostridium sp. Marseille-P2415]|uniref:DNA phosphorothioation-dependent restriction protein DptG n=1 Tax=Clostridium sp. Marseille-P2415 TaxID=1805471 RepID=UPI00098885D3|nr:DNA phosphorothioation-dependent restriction protein DptG [Clostridium sp. Marseille-P2415]